MSIAIMTQVFKERKTQGSERLLLLALADNANDEGVCWPSLQTLATKCNCTRRYIIKLMESLEARGYVTAQARYKREGEFTSNLFTLHTTAFICAMPSNLVNPSSPPSEPEYTRVVNPSSLKPSLEPSEEKPKNKNAMSSMAPLALAGKPPAQRIKLHDPLRSHSAVMAIKEITGYYPPKKLYPFVIEKLGEDVDMAKLWNCNTVMLSKGYNPRNYNCLLEWYSTNMYYVHNLDKAILETAVNPYA